MKFSGDIANKQLTVQSTFGNAVLYMKLYGQAGLEIKRHGMGLPYWVHMTEPQIGKGGGRARCGTVSRLGAIVDQLKGIEQ